MRTLTNIFQKEPTPLHIVYDIQKCKLIFVEQHNLDYFDKNLNIVFTLTSYLIGILHTLNVSFAQSKKQLIKAIDKDLSNDNSFNKNSNLYNVLVNQFGIKLKVFNNFAELN
jgi:hypothetical protein